MSSSPKPARDKNSLTGLNAISSTTAPENDPPRSGGSSSSTAERFALSGPSLILDQRVHAYRRDIADIALAGQLFAPHYARPLVRGCGSRSAFVHREASSDVEPVSELLPGEQFAVLEISGHWAWGYCRADHYVGYVEAIALTEPFEPTHVVAALAAPILPEPDAHVPALGQYPMGARVRGHEDRGFLATDSGFIPFTHVREIGAWEHDAVQVAGRMIGLPYVPGGRSGRGTNCSGLVQLSLGLCGIPAPRDSDLQRVLGRPLAEGQALQRGDLVFYDGHVGIMADANRLIHADGKAGRIVAEPLPDVDAYGPILDRRRLA